MAYLQIIYFQFRPLLATERIRALRSKLNSSDTMIQEATAVESKAYFAPPIDHQMIHDGSSRAALMAIRERLAVAQESRLPRADSNGTFQPSDATDPVATSHSMTLRSRLEAMKKRHLH
jgi:hypothetical protein